MDDGQLVIRARNGDKDAFERLVQRYGPDVSALAAYYVGPGDGQDAAQAIWLAVFQKLWQLDDPDRFVPWLKRLVYYRCLNYRKARARRLACEMYLGADDWGAMARVVAGPESLEEALERREVRRRISTLLDSLPSDYGMVLRLYYYRELDIKGISELTMLPVTTVKGRLYQGRRLLKAKLAGFLKGRKGYWNG